MNEVILEISALCITVFCLIDSLKNRKSMYLPMPKGWVNKLKDMHFSFLMQLFALILSAITSDVSLFFEYYIHYKNATMIDFLNEIYFIVQTVMTVLFVLYILNMTGAGKNKTPRFFFLFLLPFFIAEFLVLINPFTRFIYYVNEEVLYTRGPYMWVLYAISAIYLLLGIIFFVKYRSRITRRNRIAVMILMLVGVLGIILQGLFSLKVELFCVSVSYLGLMMLLEDDGRRDATGRSGRISGSFVVAIVLIFVAVIGMNISVIFNSGTEQTAKIGSIKLDNIKGDLQETISTAESDLLRYAMGLERLIDDEASEAELTTYIEEESRYFIQTSSGNCFNVYAASGDWTIIPGFDIPDGFHATERSWYIGAVENAGRIFITEPYVDANTKNLCYTLSYVLSDGSTVAALDFSLKKPQASIEAMSADDEGQMAMIVTQNGTIVGCSDVDVQGQILRLTMPEYEDIFERVAASDEHKSFKTKIGGRSKTVFSSEMSNGWLLILIVSGDNLYADTYRQIMLIGSIDILMVAVIIVFYMVSLHNQEMSEETLNATEEFIAGLSQELKAPVNDIIKISDNALKDGGPDVKDKLREVRDTSKRLKEMMDNLFFYSDILRSNMEEFGSIEIEQEKGQNVSTRYIRNGIIGVLMAALLIGFAMSFGSAYRWGSTLIGKEADNYNNEVTQWMLEQQSVMKVIADTLAYNPEVLDDYDGAVKWLNDIGSNYSDISSFYVANPNSEHPMIENTGWIPDEDYKVEERQWYIDTVNSVDGYNISAPYFDAQTGLYCITFSKALYTENGEFIGVFAIDCYLDKLIDILNDSYGKEGYAFLVDQDGNIINHPDKAHEMSDKGSVNIADTEYADALHKSNVFVMVDYDGKYVSCCTKKSNLSGFTVVVVQNFWAIYGAVVILLFIFLVMILVSMIAVFLLINRFISWQDETNEKLVTAANEAVSAGKAKSRFLAQMSHEIRTPINAVLGMNEMILRESKDASIREYAINIQSAGRNLLGLINTILDFSKIEEGKMEILPVKYDTVAMITNMINSVSARAKDKGLTFEAHVSPNIPSTMHGDDMRVTQVAINLLTNAVKYTREGRVDLYIGGEEKDKDTYSLAIRVEDTGIGIKEEDMGKLFESFARLDERKNRNIEGTGLGMAIVTKLLDMMGSKLDVESEYGEGSTFSFEVDQVIIDPTPIGDYKERIRDIGGDQDEEKYLYAPEASLLVVDDNEMNLKVIKNLLKLNGITPDLAGSGQAALDMLEKKTYDVVLLDHMMPHMDGIETLQKAREDKLLGEHTTVIALTANAVVGARESYLAAGFDDYLSKPVEVKVLEQALAKYLPGHLVQFKNRSDSSDATKETAPAPAPAPASDTAPTAAFAVKSSSGSEADNASVADIPDIMEFEPGQGLTSETKYRSQDETASRDFCEFLRNIGIVPEDGLKYCAGDEDFYHEIIIEYADGTAERLNELDDAFKQGDLDLYGVKVHALKSVARTVGDTAIFEEARALEEAAEAGNEEYVKDNHEKLKNSCTERAKVIKGGIK